MNSINHYELLGLEMSASDSEIRSAFKKLALEHHPDVAADPESAQRKFVAVRKAHDVLTDPIQRQRYDESIREAAEGDPLNSAESQRRTQSHSRASDDRYSQEQPSAEDSHNTSDEQRSEDLHISKIKSTQESSGLPSRNHSIALGAAAYAVLSVGFTFLALRGGTAVQAAAGCFGCLVILAGPMLAVWHYTSTHRLTLLPGQGAGMGAITGAIGALVSGLVSQALIALDVLPDTAEALALQREQMLSQGMDPAQIDSAMGVAESLGALSSNPVLGILAGVALGAALGALFGALASVTFKKGGPSLEG